MMPARSAVAAGGVSSNKVKYSRLAGDEDGYIDLQFKKSPPKVPYKAIALATFLFLIGSLLIVIGALLLAGSIEVSVSSSQTYVHYIAKSTRAPARQTSHYKIMAINMELVPPFVLQWLSTRCWNIAAGTCFHSATGISEVGH
uniref:Transmembrane protein 230a n=1 Tax=Oncorhynchus kisutch TaxID=8019 RepID=A0A8C7D5Y7_ONCKI